MDNPLNNKALRRAILPTYFIISIFLVAFCGIWIYTELLYLKNPIEFYDRWKITISKADSAVYQDSRVFIPKGSIILDSSLHDSFASVEFLYNYNYLIACYLVPNKDYEFFVSTYLTLIDTIVFGDLAGRSFRFRFGSDTVFMLFEIENYYTKLGSQYLITVFIPEKKVYLIMTGSDLDVSKAIELIRTLIYKNENISVELIDETATADKS